MQTDFQKRVSRIWQGMKRRCEEKRFKSGRNAGRIRQHAIPLPFTAKELEAWLLKRRGSPDKPYQCRYCTDWITLNVAVIDHMIPLRFNGTAGFENLEDICEDCNNAKGGVLPESFERLQAFLRELGVSSPRCAQDIYSRLKVATVANKERKRQMASAQKSKQALAAASVAGPHQDEEDF